jgi:hypothetical protein
MIDVPDGSEASPGEFVGAELSGDGDIWFLEGMLSRTAGQFKCRALGVANRESIVQNLDARKLN